MQEMWIRSLSREDPLQEEMATHSRILAWEIPRTGETGGLQSIKSTEHAHMHTVLTQKKHIKRQQTQNNN